MSSAQVDRPMKVATANKKENEKVRKTFNASHKKYKHEDGRHFKFSRKRSQSFTGNGKFFPPYKRRKKEGGIIPPTKFLLGGNICDPLNLNSMQDEEVNRAMNAVTPKSSPLPTPKHRKEAIEVIIPPNICDPLNLSNCNDDEYEKQLISPTKKGSKRRNRKRKRASSGSGKDDAVESTEAKIKEKEDVTKSETLRDGTSESVVIRLDPVLLVSPPRNPPKQEVKLESPLKEKNKLRLKGLEDIKDKRLRKMDIKDKIVSPVIPQPGAWKPRPQHRPSQDKKKKQQKLPNFRAKDAQYQYGNYNRYYGYRNAHNDVDTRLNVFAQRKEMFYGKDVLDIGCNIGHITLSVARDLSARSVTGIDIDRKLINIARKNVKHYVNCVRSPASHADGKERKDCDASFYPMSMPISYGPVDIPGFTKNKRKGFPYNVTFVQGNYILEDDALLSSEQPQFDTILCLSITKWLHLNFGDSGLKRAFKRMHAQLRPGGVLVLEPQNWSSYGKKKNLTEVIHKNYHSIEFLPHKFTQYLLSPEIGFSKCEVVSIPPHPSKGFQRPIQLFTKVALSPENPGNALQSSSGQSEPRGFDRDLFPKGAKKDGGNMSDMSQVSTESLSQYEQLENVYAPSATPCYDTPLYNNDCQPIETKKMCYVDIDIAQRYNNEKGEGEVNENLGKHKETILKIIGTDKQKTYDAEHRTQRIEVAKKGVKDGGTAKRDETSAKKLEILERQNKTLSKLNVSAKQMADNFEEKEQVIQVGDKVEGLCTGEAMEIEFNENTEKKNITLKKMDIDDREERKAGGAEKMEEGVRVPTGDKEIGAKEIDAQATAKKTDDRLEAVQENKRKPEEQEKFSDVGRPIEQCARIENQNNSDNDAQRKMIDAVESTAGTDELHDSVDNKSVGQTSLHEQVQPETSKCKLSSNNT